MEVGHSRLLKFFKEGYKTPNMEEVPVIKIQKEYKNPENVESEVPGTQTIRESDDKNIDTSSDIGTSEIQITSSEFTLSPVITVTNKETSLTKGDLKLQKVTVTEDIAVSYKHLFKKDVKPGKTVVTSVQKFEYKY
nr:uncharacterized protein LOC126056178 [Helicoverpa armigera]